LKLSHFYSTSPPLQKRQKQKQKQKEETKKKNLKKRLLPLGFEPTAANTVGVQGDRAI